jgi:hypothetical protein
MSSKKDKVNESSEYHASKIFCETKEYFTIVASSHRFLRDCLVNTDLNTSYKISNKIMVEFIEKYKDTRDILNSIIRTLVVAANNIDIQYTNNDENNTETNILQKLYDFLKVQLPNNISMINTVYKMYNLDTKITKTLSPGTHVPEVKQTITHTTRPSSSRFRTVLNTTKSRALGGDIKN